MSETPNYLKVKTTGASYLGWRGELLAKLALAWIPGLTIDKSLNDQPYDFYVKTNDGVRFFVEVKAFSSLGMSAKNVEKVKELRLQMSTTLVDHAHEVNRPAVIFLFDADTDHGRFLRLDTLPAEEDKTHDQIFKFPIENTINKTSLEHLIDIFRADLANDENQTQPYVFDNYPLTILLIHRPDSPKPIETQHRVRKPTIDEWVQWGREIKNTRRYLLPAEIEEEIRRNDDEDEITEAYETSYREWDASKSLYDKIILEIAGYRFGKEDKHSVKELRTPTQEMLEKLWFEHKEIVITRLYKCFCSVDEDSEASTKSDEVWVRQELPPDSSPYAVTHVLRKPTEEESYRFRSTIVQEQIPHDSPETLNLILNLPAAIELYDALIIKIENATVNGQPFSETTRHAFLVEINPVYKLRVLEALLNVRAWAFKVDEVKVWIPRW